MDAGGGDNPCAFANPGIKPSLEHARVKPIAWVRRGV
jgi:hypothetical protein